MTQGFLRGVFVATSATLAFLLGCPAFTAQPSRGAVAAFPEFKAHLVDRLPGGYKVTLYRPGRQGNGVGEQKTRLASGEQVDPAKRGSSEIVVGRVGHKMGRFLATIEPWHGDKVVVYTPGPDAHIPWQRTVIDATFNEGHALICADVDADGDDEMVAGYRGKGQSLYIYDYVGSMQTKWKRIPLDEGDMAASGLDAADINADGHLDIICVGTASSNIKWYENLGQPH